MKDVKRFIDSRLGMYSFYFEDLNSGYCYVTNENVIMPAAGCIKLPIAISLMHQAEEGNIDFKDKIFIGKKDMIYNGGILNELDEREYSINELMIAMLMQNDDTATNKLIDIMGIDEINSGLYDMGLMNTKLTGKFSQKNLQANKNVSTCKDISKCWKLLLDEKFLSQEHSSRIINILKKQQVKNRITFFYLEKIKDTVASNPGEEEYVENDTAYIDIDKGKFIVTVMSNNLPNNVYGMVTVSKIGKMVLDIIQTSWN
ncbi:serine hydrolase [Clostridium sp. 19966]|uniref:serine hydrolase n=1 Tax=Clostridium sp. 19966 TaxID=2768166 RepID=UPI0028DE1C30|nr:serine hydrolase [Clostridium sp. 19966]MDT8719087.1 serine hydrolase [Clostridium sp. 19966]